MLVFQPSEFGSEDAVVKPDLGVYLLVVGRAGGVSGLSDFESDMEVSVYVRLFLIYPKTIHC